MPNPYSSGLLFPNYILHSWTYEGSYYAITTDFRIFVSSNKFAYSSTYLGDLPFAGCDIAFVWGSTGRVEMNIQPVPSSPDVQYTLANLLVKGNVIFVEVLHLELGLQSYISKDLGLSWTNLSDSMSTVTPDHISQFSECENIWRGGVASFMCVDERGCNTYIFKPMFKASDDNTYRLSGWLIVRDDGVVINNRADPTLDVLNIERRFSSSGDLISQYDNKLNTMDGHLEKYRKPYTLRWPQYQPDTETNPRCIDRSGFIVNPFDVVHVRTGDKHNWVIQIPQEIHIKLGLLAEKENRYLPDRITTRVPIFYVMDVNTLKDANVDNKAPIRVLDLHGFDTYLAPLHKAQVTTRAGVYSFIEKMLGKSVSIFDSFGKPGTVYSFDAPTGETFPSRVFIDGFQEHCTGDLIKITDPEYGRDVVAFLSRDRIKVCITDPSKEYNWIDKTKTSTFVRSAQRVSLPPSVAVLPNLATDNTRTLTPDVWCGYDTVLRYDYEDNRLLGYPVYSIGQSTDPADNLVAYNFPAFIRNGANDYSIGYSTVSGLEYRETNVNRQQNLSDQQTDLYRSLFYGGFVGDTHGYIGSLTKFVNGILVPPEPEAPTEPVPNPPEPSDPPLSVPATIALLDDITHSSTANIASNRRAVDFGVSRGSAIANIAVGSSKWYLELSAISNDNIFFGVAKAGFDVNKEPGDDSSVVAVGMEGQVLRSGNIIYKTSTPLIDFNAGGDPTIGVVIDMDNRVLQFTNGDGSFYSQAIGGLPSGSLTLYIGATANTADSTVSSVAINFGQLPFKYTVPNGVHRGYGIA